MSIKIILQNGDAVLRKAALPVPKKLFGTPELTKIITDLSETLDEQPDGVALAAPQIGISYRLFIVRYDRTLPAPPEGTPPESIPVPVPEVGIFINPTFVRNSRRRSEVDEGCLSVRGMYGTTVRYDRATIRAQTPEGVTFERGGGGLLAQIFQHEVDHLDGILFIDHAANLAVATHKQTTDATKPI